jgi:release factor glutamine methyltransferase
VPGTGSGTGGVRRATSAGAGDDPEVRLLRLPGTYPAQRDTRLLADVLRRDELPRGRRVLDVATGGGALAVVAARAGAASVTAVDVSTRSVLTARLNARLHRVPVRVRRGDLFAPVRGERFDVITANPPYVPALHRGLPHHTADRSWDAGPDGRALLDRICDGAGPLLADGGVLLVVQSAVADETRTLERLRAVGLQARVVARAREPFGPVMTRRAALLESRGLIEPGQRVEELVVVEGRAPGSTALGQPGRLGA